MKKYLFTLALVFVGVMGVASAASALTVGDLAVTGNSQLQGTVVGNAEGEMTIASHLTLDGNFYATRNVEFQNVLNSTGFRVFEGLLLEGYMFNDKVVDDEDMPVDIRDNVRLRGDLDVEKGLKVTEDLSIEQGLVVGDGVTVASGIMLNSDYEAGDVYIMMGTKDLEDEDMDVKFGWNDENDYLWSNAALKLGTNDEAKNLGVSGNVDVQGFLHNSTENNSGKVYVNDDMEIESTLKVKGQANFDDQINLAGSLYSTVSDILVLEGTTSDEFETTVQVADPSADNTITIPDESGTLALTQDVPQVVTSEMELDSEGCSSAADVGKIRFENVSNTTDADGEMWVCVDSSVAEDEWGWKAAGLGL